MKNKLTADSSWLIARTTNYELRTAGRTWNP